jgi:hypothetical protein
MPNRKQYSKVIDRRKRKLRDIEQKRAPDFIIERQKKLVNLSHSRWLIGRVRYRLRQAIFPNSLYFWWTSRALRKEEERLIAYVYKKR